MMMMSIFMNALSCALHEGIVRTRNEDTILKFKVGQRYGNGVVTELLPQHGLIKVEYPGGKIETITAELISNKKI